MAHPIDLQAHREASTGQRSARADQMAMMAPTLACPQCEVECRLVTMDENGSAIYRCVGNGHRSLTWSIDEGGAMRHGTSGALYN
jgi:Zn ribbon nucleic-acid-binding protein